MKIFFFSLLFSSYSTFCFAQPALPDPSFGCSGIVKADIGSALIYNNFGREILIHPDGCFFMVFEAAGLTLITKKNSDGSTDTTYGNKGYSAALPIIAYQAVLQNDGKIIVVGSTDVDYNNRNYAIARYNTDGSIDKSFGGDGIQIFRFNGTDAATSVAIQTDGKIVVAGSTFDGRKQFIGLIRYNSDGTLDNSFGQGGIQTTDLGFNDFFNSIVIRTDGKIVVGGTALMRYNTNGELDSTFNGVGRQAITGLARKMAIQNDNKIIVAVNTYYYDTVNVDFGVARFNADGGADSTFGDNGIRTTNFGGISQTLTSMVVQNDGKLVLGGYAGIRSDTSFAIARYEINGILDSSFSDNGMQISDFGYSKNILNSIAIRNDGKLVAFGHAGTDSILLAVARYNNDGSLDGSFVGDGTLTDRLIQGSTSFTYTAIQDDGKVIAAGYTWNGNNYDFALVRYNLNGTPDPGFSFDGVQLLDFGSTDDRAAAIAIQADGKIVVVGSAGNKTGLARYNTGGTLDSSFNSTGIITATFGISDSASSVIIQSDGRILVGGTRLVRYNINGSLDSSFSIPTNLTDSYGRIYAFDCNDLAIQNDGKIVLTGGGSDLIVTRYNTDGSIDSSFGVNGVYSNYEEVGKSIEIQNDGKIVIGGYRETSTKGGTFSKFMLTRLNANGSLDINFNGGGIIYNDINSRSYANSVIIQPDNKIILAGYSLNESSDNFTMIRYNTDGLLDYTFGNNGILETEASLSRDRIAALATRDNKLYAVGFGQYPGNFGVIARYLLNTAAGPFTSAATGYWNEPGTWIGSVVPGASSEVRIQHNVTITTNTTCYSLKVEGPGGKIVIMAGVNLMITH